MTSKAKSLEEGTRRAGRGEWLREIVKAATSRKTAEKYAIKRLAQYL